MPFFIPASASNANGLPLEVANEAERLLLEPPEGTRVKQLDTGMVWAAEDGNWWPAPSLTESVSPSQVAQYVTFQSRNYPSPTSGSLIALSVGDSRILPAQQWCSNIGQFVGSPVEASLTLMGAITYVDPELLTDRLSLIGVVVGGASDFNLSGLALENSREILAALWAETQTLATLLTLNLSGGTNSKISAVDVNYLAINDASGCSAIVNLQPAVAAGHTDATGWSSEGATGDTFQVGSDGASPGIWHAAPHLMTQIAINGSSQSSPIVDFDFSSFSILEALTIDSAFGCSGVVNIPNSVQTLLITGCTSIAGGFNFSNRAALYTLSLQGTPVPLVLVANCSSLVDINLSFCSLPEENLDTIVQQVHANAVANNLNGGVLSLNNQTTFATPSGAVASLIADLETTYGWTITT